MEVGQARLVVAIGAIDGINKDFRTLTNFIFNTTRVFHNGVLLDPNGGPDYDGWIEGADHRTITMNFAPETGDTMFIYYEEVEGSIIYNIGGMPGGLPKMISAVELTPVVRRAIELKPDLISTSMRINLIPELIKLIDLKPEIKQSIDLKPKIIDTEVN